MVGDTAFEAREIRGLDFTSAPSARKPITAAHARLESTDDRGVRSLHLQAIERLTTLEAWSAWLMHPGPWLAGCDLPFGLPRPLVEALGWPRQWHELMQWYAAQPRAELRTRFKAYCDARPPGQKFAHRATDLPAGSSPSMKWVNPPVAWMMHAGVPRLMAAGVHLPGLHAGDPQRVALEAYPGFLARRITPHSYKSDEKSRQTAARQAQRERIADAICEGVPCVLTGERLRVHCPQALRSMLIEDATGDSLDAVLCAVQAAQAAQLPGYGMPAWADPLEGWIAGVPPLAGQIAPGK